MYQPQTIVEKMVVGLKSLTINCLLLAEIFLVEEKGFA